MAASSNAALQKRLAAMKAKWNASRTESKKSQNGTTLSEGAHMCKVSVAEIREGDKGPYVFFEFMEVEGDEVGEKAVYFRNIDTDENIIWLQRDLRRLEIDVDDFDITDLPAKLKELVTNSPGVRLKVKKNGEYTNVYIDKLVQLDGDPAPEETPTETEEAPAEEAEAPPEESEAPEEPEAPEELEPEAEALEAGAKIAWAYGKQKGTGVFEALQDDPTKCVIKDDKSKKRLLVATADVSALVV